MGRDAPIIFMMFGIVMVSLIIVGIAWYYGTESWTWMAQQNALLVLVLMVLGVAMFTLIEWLRHR